MKITENTQLKDLILYLRNNFSVGIYSVGNAMFPSQEKYIFKRNTNKVSKKVKSWGFDISEELTIGEIKLLLDRQAGLNTEFRNDQGIQLSPEIRLGDAASVRMSPDSNTTVVNTALNSSISIISEQPSNADFDWVYRMLKNTAYKLKTNEDKLMMIKTIKKICEISPDASVTMLAGIIRVFCIGESDFLTVSNEMSHSGSEKVSDLLSQL